MEDVLKYTRLQYAVLLLSNRFGTLMVSYCVIQASDNTHTHTHTHCDQQTGYPCSIKKSRDQTSADI